MKRTGTPEQPPPSRKSIEAVREMVRSLPAERTRAAERLEARIRDVQPNWPAPVWEAYLATLDGVQDKDSAVVAGTPVSTFKKYKARIRRELARAAPAARAQAQHHASTV